MIVRAWFADVGPALNLHGWPEFEFVTEIPELTPNDTNTAKNNDLIHVAMGAQHTISCLAWTHPQVVARARIVSAQRWKGQVKKPIHHGRVWRVLTDAERQTVAECCGSTPSAIEQRIQKACHLLAVTGEVKSYSWKGHNLLDAVGLNLEHTGRLRR